jgi:hypothetical protein
VKAALERVTSTLIDCTARYRDAVGAERVIGNLWPYVALPDGVGVAITQDYMPLLGPEQYAEFELPLLERIAARFGGVYLHCCGAYARHLPALARSPMKVWGLEVHHPETTVADVRAAFGDRVAVTPYVAPTGQREFASLAAMVRSWKGTPLARGRYWFCFCPEWGDAAELRRAVREVCGG